MQLVGNRLVTRGIDIMYATWVQEDGRFAFSEAPMGGDCIEVAADDYASLFAGQVAGKAIGRDDDGRPILLDPPPPTTEQIIASLTADVQAHMDAAAQALGYDDIKSAVTYADEPAVRKFQEEGIAFRAWRSLCWEHCYAVLNAVQSGEREQPLLEELIAELPSLAL